VKKLDESKCTVKQGNLLYLYVNLTYDVEQWRPCRVIPFLHRLFSSSILASSKSRLLQTVGRRQWW